MIRGFGSPAALALWGLAVPILVTYMLKPRRPRWLMPSTFLWEEALANVAATKPWQRIRPSVTLLLQMLLLSALVMGAARPYVLGEGVEGSHLILVLDASGSMQSTDHAPSRIDAAKAQARRLIDGLTSSGSISVVVADTRPRVLVSATRDPRAAKRAVDSIQAHDAPADFAEAFLLAESLEGPQEPATIALITDGGLTAEEQRMIPAGTVIRDVGRSRDNLAITQISIEQTASGSRSLVSVKNFSDRTRSTLLSLSLDDAALTTVPIKVAPGATVERTLDLGAGSGELIARLDSDDALAADDRAYAVLGRTRATRIMLVTPGNLFLEKLLQQVPGSRVDVVQAPGRFDGYDLAVFDRVPVPERVALPALFVAPSTPPQGVQVAGTIASPSITSVAQDPILDDVDLSDLAVAEMMHAVIPDAKVLVGSGPAPMIAVWEQDRVRRALIAFDLHQSNLPLQVAFPILADHLLSWLSGGSIAQARHAGDPIKADSPAGVTSVEVTTPERGGTTLRPGETLVTSRAGFYRFRYLAGSEEVLARTIGLSFPRRESLIEPTSVQAGQAGSRPGLTGRARKPLTAVLAAVALALLLIEWWWAHGRPLAWRSS